MKLNFKLDFLYYQRIITFGGESKGISKTNEFSVDIDNTMGTINVILFK